MSRTLTRLYDRKGHVLAEHIGLDYGEAKRAAQALADERGAMVTLDLTVGSRRVTFHDVNPKGLA